MRNHKMKFRVEIDESKNLVEVDVEGSEKEMVAGMVTFMEAHEEIKDIILKSTKFFLMKKMTL